MCLITKNIEPNIEEKDIICFKVIEENKDKNCPYKTPYKETLIEKEVINGTKEFIGEGNRNNKSFLTSRVMVAEGYIHTFKNYAVAFNECEFLNKAGSKYGFKYHVFKCVIPANTKHYEGFDNIMRPSYASEKIKFVKEINNMEEKVKRCEYCGKEIEDTNDTGSLCYRCYMIEYYPEEQDL